MYCLSKTKLPVKVIPLNVWRNDYLEHTPHNKDKFDKTYQVYYDRGKDFNEQDRDNFKYLIKENLYILDLNITENLNKLRLDLTDAFGVAFKVINIKGVTPEELIWQDFLLYKNYYVSNSNDPKVIINKKIKKGSHIIITMDIKDLNKKELFNIINNITLEKNKIETNLLDLNKKLHQLEVDIETIYNSLSWKITKPLRFIRAKFKK